MTKNKELSPSAFIPFCSFGEDPVGTTIEGFDVPVCDIFEPKIHNDQLCYETDLEEIRSKDNDIAMKQLKVGLVLILDYNFDRQFDFALKEELKNTSKKRLYFNYNDDNDALLFFNTISNNNFKITIKVMQLL